MKKDVRTLKDRVIDIDLSNNSVIFWTNLVQQRLRHMKEYIKDQDTKLNRKELVKYLEITLEEIWNAKEHANHIETEASVIYNIFKEQENEK